MLFFPFLILLGAGARTSKITHTVCQFTGDISYPVYMIHYPFIWLFMSYVEKYKPGLVEMTWIIVIGIVVLTMMAYLILKYVNAPLRAMLKRRSAAYQA